MAMAKGFGEHERTQAPYGETAGRYGRRFTSEGNYGQQNRGSQGQGSTGSSLNEPVWSYTEVWLVPGPHSGRGPGNYQRSNERIKEDVCERLTYYGQLDASNIEVEVENGEVILKGTVDSRRSKRMAEDIAESVSGVRDIHNQLRIEWSPER
jgi:hypothetical protein